MHNALAIMQVTVSVVIVQVRVFAMNKWVTIMQAGFSVAIMPVVFSAVYYAHDCLYY